MPFGSIGLKSRQIVMAKVKDTRIIRDCTTPDGENAEGHCGFQIIL